MDIGTLICVIVIFAPIIILFIYILRISTKRYPGGEIPAVDMNFICYQIDAKARMKGWSADFSPYRGKVTIIRDSLVGTDLYFQYQPDGKMSISYTPTAGIFGWVLIILLLPTFVGSIFMGMYLHSAAGKFTIEEAIPQIIPVISPIEVVHL